jgi:hypothetical protein
MLDNLSILLTCGAIVLVAWRAIRLDAARPWFAPPPRPDVRQQRR